MRFKRRKGDYHIHSSYSSDGHMGPEKIIYMAEAKGLKTIAVTDHGTIKGGQKTKEVARFLKTDLEVIVGAEIKTDKGEIIGLGLSEEVKATEIDAAIDEVKKQGGDVYVPHPFDKFRGSALGEYTYEIGERIDYIEVFNGRCLLTSFDKKAGSFADENGLAKLAGSDAHFGFEMGNLTPGPGRFMKALMGHILTKTGMGKWL